MAVLVAYVTLHNKLFFYGEELSAPHPTPKLEIQAEIEG
jgi:hypothetical protein